MNFIERNKQRARQADRWMAKRPVQQRTDHSLVSWRYDLPIVRLKGVTLWATAKKQENAVRFFLSSGIYDEWEQTLEGAVKREPWEATVEVRSPRIGMTAQDQVASQALVQLSNLAAKDLNQDPRFAANARAMRWLVTTVDWRVPSTHPGCAGIAQALGVLAPHSPICWQGVHPELRGMDDHELLAQRLLERVTSRAEIYADPETANVVMTA